MDLCLADFDPAMADALVPMWRQSFEHGVGVRDPHTLDDQRDYLLQRLWPAYALKVAFDGAQLVGFVASDAESVMQLYVRVGCHGRGIGSTLLDHAKASSAGTLWLYTFARNANARRFYERHGFVATAFGFEPTWQLDDVRYEWRRPTPENPA